MSTDGEDLRRHARTINDLFEWGDEMAALLDELVAHDRNGNGRWTTGMHNRVSVATQLWRANAGAKLP